jgi:hypothetical protein
MAQKLLTTSLGKPKTEGAFALLALLVTGVFGLGVLEGQANGCSARS